MDTETITQERITPKVAQRYLDSTVTNRAVTQMNVTKLASQMLNGEWVLTHQGIAFDEEGHLIDGRHRMLAIIESGVTVETMVTRGVPHEAFLAMDTGRPRGPADILSITTGVHNPTRVVATLKLVWCYENQRESKHWSGSNIALACPPPVLIEMFAKHPSVSEWVKVGTSLRHDVPVNPSAASAVALLVAEKTGSDLLITDFIAGLKSGAALEIGDVRLLVRSYFFNKSLAKIRTTTREDMAVLIKSWNFWIDSASPKVLKFSGNESFPIIQG